MSWSLETKYRGRCFTSVKIRPIYSPRIPIERSCTPENNIRATVSVGQPLVGLPLIKVSKTTYIPYAIATKEIKKETKKEELKSSIVNDRFDSQFDYHDEKKNSADTSKTS